jgi:hypothetical protein
MGQNPEEKHGYFGIGAPPTVQIPLFSETEFLADRITLKLFPAGPI